MRVIPCLAIAAALLATSAEAQIRLPDNRPGGKLLLTGGVSALEGAGGGGLATWAVTTGYGAQDGIGGNVHATWVNLPDYELRTWGGA
ncbi:MAG: DUF3034 family protein, partial [Brevundimonas sp.]